MAKRLTGEHPSYSTFRLAVAEIMITREKYLEAVQFILWCEDQEPENEQYRSMLGIAYAKGGTSDVDEARGSRLCHERRRCHGS